jgi:hypothetical protein
MQVVVTGTSGADKMTLARRIAPRFRTSNSAPSTGSLPNVLILPSVLMQCDPDEFARRVAVAIAADSWIVDGQLQSSNARHDLDACEPSRFARLCSSTDRGFSAVR